MMTLSTCPGWGACARRHRRRSSSRGRSTSLYQLLAGEVTKMNDYLAQMAVVVVALIMNSIPLISAH